MTEALTVDILLFQIMAATTARHPVEQRSGQRSAGVRVCFHEVVRT